MRSSSFNHQSFKPAPILKAEPNPVDMNGAYGVTRVSWDMGEGGAGQVYVSVGDREEQLFADGGKGSMEAPWIGPGVVYRFRLYQGANRERCVSSVEVWAQTASGGHSVFQANDHGITDKLREAWEADGRENERLRLALAVSLAPNSNCIDVGGHSGNVLRDMIRCAPQGCHIAYEPLPHFYRQLVQHYPHVDVRNAALSNRRGMENFIHVKTQPGYSGFRKRDYPGEEVLETITVQVEDLDSSLPPGYVPHLIKIDVEGAERLVIEGAIQTITRHKPLIIFEHGRGASEHYGTQPEHIIELLCMRAGLRIFDLEGNGPYSPEEFKQAFDTGSRWNFIARL